MRALAFAAALLAAAPAWAVYQCGDTKDTCQCGANNPYPCCDNGGNCTWYAWHSACCSWGVGLPGWGNANQWAGNAAANANYAVRSFPVSDAVSCRTSGSYGHVAFVTALTSSGITVKEQNCWGNYGARTANYSSAYFDKYITRKGQVQCAPGDTQTQACGNCGTQKRGCGNDGKWGAWGTCGSQGVCAAGAEDVRACGGCGTQRRSCSSSCQWAAWPSQCTAGADPDGGTLACDTGQPGACADGRLRCGDGGVLACEALQQPSTETCDGLDNDCNGAADDGVQCLGPPPASVRDGGEQLGEGSPPGPGPGSALPSDSARGGCSTTGAGLGALGLWAALAARKRGSRRSAR